MELASHVHWVQVDDVVFVLDVRRGEYFGLDPRTSDLWLRLTRAGGYLPEECDHAALWGIVEAARVRGWLAESGQTVLDDRKDRLGAVRHWRPFLTLSAYMCLVRAFAFLKCLGFSRTYGWAQSIVLASSVRNQNNIDASMLERDLTAFFAAEHVFISPLGLDDCLPRSLALFVFLRRCGIPVRHLIGVRRYPFRAHAWVEYDGLPLLAPVMYGRTTRLASADLLGDFTPLATIG